MDRLPSTVFFMFKLTILMIHFQGSNDLHDHCYKSYKDINKVKTENSKHKQPFTNTNKEGLEKSNVLKYFSPAHFLSVKCRT